MSRKWVILLLTLCLAVQTTLIFAEEDEFSPWESWRQGISNYEKGEQNKNKGNYEEALKYFQRAREYYVSVQNNRPEWNQKIIGARVKLCDQEIRELKKESSRKQLDSKTFDESTSPKSSSATSSDFPESNSKSSYSKNVDSESSELRAELDMYKKKYFAILSEADDLRRESERNQGASREVENILKEKGVLQQQLSLLQQKYDSLNEKLTQPDIEKNELKNRLLEDKMQMEILNQKLKMQDENYEKIRREMAELYKAKTESKFTNQQSEQKIRELNDQILRYDKESSDRNVQIRNLNARIEQLTQTNSSNLASIKEKQEEVSKLNKWIEELREKGGSQSKMNSEIITENKTMREKFDSMKDQNDKLAQENQELKNKQLELHISFGQLKDTIKNMNDQKNSVVNEYNNLTRKYNQSILEDGANAKEMQNLREQNSKLERELKLFVDKYEKTQKRLDERSANEYQTVLAVYKTNSELTDKLNAKSDYLAELKIKYEQLDKANRDSLSAISDLKSQNTCAECRKRQPQGRFPESCCLQKRSTDASAGQPTAAQRKGGDGGTER
jgi:chromosome segregation ATPase